MMKARYNVNRLLCPVLLVLLLMTLISIIGGENERDIGSQADSIGSLNIFHVIAGSAIFALSLLHILLHRQWIKAAVARSLNKQPRVRANRTTLKWLVIPFILCAITGIINTLVQNNTLEPFLLSAAAWSGLHRLTGIMTLILLLVHAVQHRNWFSGLFKRRKDNEVPEAGKIQ